MFILEIHADDSGMDYVGPFPTRERAQQYADTAKRHGWYDYTILELTVPYAVVKKVEWR